MLLWLRSGSNAQICPAWLVFILSCSLSCNGTQYAIRDKFHIPAPVGAWCETCLESRIKVSNPFGCFTPFRPANTMWRKLLYSGFHTPKAVTYHEPTIMWLFMIGHSLGRMETCFGPSTQGARIRYQNTSQIQILLAAILKKKVAWCNFF